MGARRFVGRAWRMALAALVLAVVGLLAAAPAGAGTGERIRSYTVEVVIGDDGVLEVTEEIAYDFGTNQRRGIFRDIPVRLRYDDEHDRVFPFELLDVSATPPGTPDDVAVQDAGNAKRLRIGDPDVFIDGEHTYTIRYRMEGALNAFESHDELFWNAVGTEWTVPIERVRVEVRAPGEIAEVACFAGPRESDLPCDGAERGGTTATFSHEGLFPAQGVSVVVALPKGTVPEPAPVLRERWTIDRAFSRTPVTLGGAGVLLVGAMAGVGTLAWRQGRDRRYVGSPVDVAFGNDTGEVERVPVVGKHETPVEFAPPEGIRPGQLGTLIDEVANPLDVTATVLDLAVRGRLRIEEVETAGKPDWRLVRTGGDENLLPYEQELHRALFSGRDSVLVSELRYTFADDVRRVQERLYRDVVEQHWFPTRPDHVRQRWIAIGVGVAALGAGLTALAAWLTTFGLLPLPIALAGVLVAVFARRMPHRTARGTGMLRRIEGFRRLLTTEGAIERFRHDERARIFSEYLPYAVVFGCADQWARAFEALGDELPQPGWYVSPYPFHTVMFVHSIGSFSAATAGNIVMTQAATSGGSGFSGLSGGFSGGGIGGGGGGSW